MTLHKKETVRKLSLFFYIPNIRLYSINSD